MWEERRGVALACSVVAIVAIKQRGNFVVNSFVYRCCVGAIAIKANQILNHGSEKTLDRR